MTLSVVSTTDTRVGAGIFNRRITIQYQDKAQDVLLSNKPNWTTLCSTWAYLAPWQVRGEAGTEAPIAGQMFPNELTRILLRYRPSMNIQTGMRVVYGAHTFNIAFVHVLAEAYTTIELLCEELRAAGSKH